MRVLTNLTRRMSVEWVLIATDMISQLGCVHRYLETNLEGVMFDPVSYTHLDVYKRQVPYSLVYRATEIKTNGVTNCTRCLLYTSHR